MTSLEACDVSIGRGDRIVIRNFSHRFEKGSFSVVAGENGAGKTSLLRTLSGQIPPQSGSVLFQGQNILRIPSRDLARKRSFLAQQTECRLPFTAFEVVLLGAEAAGFRGVKARNLALDSLHEARVHHLQGRIISDLSGGEQQRIHWARTLAQMGQHPTGHLLLLDEPVSSLDVAHQHHLLATARAFTRMGTTVIAVLHDLNLASRYADELVLLHQGTVAQIGTPGEVLTPDLISHVFHFSARVIRNPVDQTPLVLPEGIAASDVSQNPPLR